MRTYIDLDLDLRVHDIVGEVACHCATVAEVVAVQYKAINVLPRTRRRGPW